MAWYTPLPDASTCIRLLQVEQPRSVDEIEEISCSVIVCKLSLAPNYEAISYTWGSPALTRNITIQGHRVPVRENCHNALLQATQQGCTFIWIDALCIDQENLDEKSRQVAIMGSIYEGATHVILPFGPHVEESLFLVKYLPIYKALHEPNGDWTSAFDRMERELGSGHLLRFANALVWFASQIYWTRVWIVQEYVVASEVRVLCGADVLDLETIIDNHMNLPMRHLYHDAAAEMGERIRSELVSFSGDEQLLNSPFTKLLDQRENWRSSLLPHRNRGYEHELELRSLLDFRANDCLNPLDHIYGFLHLMKSFGPSIAPDYRITPSDLAIQCLESLPTDTLFWARQLFGALRLDRADSKIRDILTSREQGFKLACAMHSSACESEHETQLNNVLRDSLAKNLKFGTNFEKKYRLDGFVESLWLRIEEFEGGRLTGALILDLPPWYNHQKSKFEEFEQDVLSRAANFASNWNTRTQLYAGVAMPLELSETESQAVVGLLCCRTRKGDYILRTQDEVLIREHTFRVCLIVRPRFENYCEIIGQAVVSSDWAFCAGQSWEDECACPGPDLHKPLVPDRQWHGVAQPRNRRLKGFDLHLSKDDVVAFACHDLEGDKIKTEVVESEVKDLPLAPRDPWSPLHRVLTNITSSMFSSYAVRLWVEEGPLWSDVHDSFGSARATQDGLQRDLELRDLVQDADGFDDSHKPVAEMII